MVGGGGGMSLTPTSLKTLALVALALAFPLASAQPPAPELPTVRECSEFQVDWYHCYGYLVCLDVEYGRLQAAECVENPCPGFACTFCGTTDCLAPDVDFCVKNARPPFRCEDALVCAQVEYDPWFTTAPICVSDPCPDFTCVVCYPGSCAVNECSEFQVDWNHCAGYLVCVWGSSGPLYIKRQCVANPCTPGLAGCVVCADWLCTVPSASCDETISLNYGYVACSTGPGFDWHCVINCPPNVGPWYCHQDTTGRVECWTPYPLLTIEG